MKRKDKQRGPHLVPLPPVLLAQVRAWREADGKGAVYICPSVKSTREPATRGRGRQDLPEPSRTHQRALAALVALRPLDHLPRGRQGRRYRRGATGSCCRQLGVASTSIAAQRLELRRELMTWYEQMLAIAARDGAKVLPLKRSGDKR